MSPGRHWVDFENLQILDNQVFVLGCFHMKRHLEAAFLDFPKYADDLLRAVCFSQVFVLLVFFKTLIEKRSNYWVRITSIRG